MKSMNDSQPTDTELDQYLQLKNLLSKCQSILNPQDFSIDEYNQYSLEFRRYQNFLKQINFSKNLCEQKNVLINLNNIKTNLNHFLKKSGNENLISEFDQTDFSTRQIEVPILMERLQSLNDDQQHNQNQLDDISKGFDDVKNYMNNLTQKRKKTASKKNNITQLHSFNITHLEENEEKMKDPRLQRSQYKPDSYDQIDDDKDILADRKSDFQFSEEKQSNPPLYDIKEQSLKNSSYKDMSEQNDSQVENQIEFLQSQQIDINISNNYQSEQEQAIEQRSVQIEMSNEHEQEKSETYKSIQDDQYLFDVSEDNILLEAKLKMLKQKEKELTKYLTQIKNGEFKGLYSLERCRNLKNKKELDKNYKIKLFSDLNYQIELRERKNDDKLKINNKFHVDKNEIDEDGVLRLITIVQEQIMQKRSELTKLREETEKLYDEKNILNQFFQYKKMDVIQDKQVKIPRDQNREFYDRAEIFIDQKNKLEIENMELKKILQGLKQKLQAINN